MHGETVKKNDNKSIYSLPSVTLGY